VAAGVTQRDDRHELSALFLVSGGEGAADAAALTRVP
jgi:hypothetical protein